MSAISTFAPQRPLTAFTALDQIRIDACHVHVWQLLVSPRDPIVTERAIFQIQLSTFALPVLVQLGVVVMADHIHTVYRLHANHIECPSTVLVSIHPGHIADLTRLVPIVLGHDLGLTIVHIG